MKSEIWKELTGLTAEKLSKPPSKYESYSTPLLKFYIKMATRLTKRIKETKGKLPHSDNLNHDLVSRVLKFLPPKKQEDYRAQISDSYNEIHGSNERWSPKERHLLLMILATTPFFNATNVWLEFPSRSLKAIQTGSSRLLEKLPENKQQAEWEFEQRPKEHNLLKETASFSIYDF